MSCIGVCLRVIVFSVLWVCLCVMCELCLCVLSFICVCLMCVVFGIFVFRCVCVCVCVIWDLGFLCGSV